MSDTLDIIGALSGIDRRSIGRANDVVAFVLRHKSALPELVGALASENAIVRMRASDALEKVSAKHPEWLSPHAESILDAAAKRDEQEVCWHAAQILPRLDLTPDQQDAAVRLLFGFLDKPSRILRSFALTGLVEFAIRNAVPQDRVMREVRRARTSGIPSLEARARKLAKRLGSAV
jgi:HEAT repeat protein